MEKVCRVWKHCIKLCGIIFTPLLQPLIKTLISAFQQHPHSCFIYTASITIDVFAPNPAAHVGTARHSTVQRSVLEAHLDSRHMRDVLFVLSCHVSHAMHISPSSFKSTKVLLSKCHLSCHPLPSTSLVHACSHACVCRAASLACCHVVMSSC